MFSAATIRVALAAFITISFSSPQELPALGPIPAIEAELHSRNLVLSHADELVSWDRITITATDPAAEALIEWALGRFDEVGLELPALAVTVHEDQDGCDGAAGMYRPGARPQLDLCVLEDPTSMPARLITLHELAHAWAETTLTDDEKQAFLDLRGLDHWTDRDTPRHEWGAEHIAEVVSWGLMDQKVRVIRIYDAKPEQLTEAFELMVGTEPLCPTA